MMLYLTLESSPQSTQLPAGYTGVSLHSLIPAPPPVRRSGLPLYPAAAMQRSVSVPAVRAERRAQRHAEADRLSQRGAPHLSQDLNDNTSG